MKQNNLIILLAYIFKCIILYHDLLNLPGRIDETDGVMSSLYEYIKL